LLLIVALTLFNEAVPVPLHLPSVFHNPLDEEEAEKAFCLEKESIEERSEESTRNRVSHISGGSGDAQVSQCFSSVAGQSFAPASFLRCCFSIHYRPCRFTGRPLGRYAPVHSFPLVQVVSSLVNKTRKTQ
jgi:hypothetical protein